MTVSFFGKFPGRADFVRIAHQHPAALDLDTWLQRNVEDLAAHGQRWPRATLGFLFAPQGASGVLIGVLAPSTDKAHRAFPAAFYSVLPTAARTAGLPAALIACRDLLAQAAELAGRLPHLDYDDLRARVASLVEPSAQAYAAERDRFDAWLQGTAANAWLARLFGAHAADESWRKIADVFAAAAGQLGRGANLIDCPVSAVEDVALWLACAERAAEPAALPSIFWPSVSPERILLSLGSPPVNTLRQFVLAPPPAATARRVTLLAAQPPMGSGQAAQAAAHSPGASLRELVDWVARIAS